MPRCCHDALMSALSGDPYSPLPVCPAIMPVVRFSACHARVACYAHTHPPPSPAVPCLSPSRRSICLLPFFHAFAPSAVPSRRWRRYAFDVRRYVIVERCAGFAPAPSVYDLSTRQISVGRPRRCRLSLCRHSAPVE